MEHSDKTRPGAQYYSTMVLQCNHLKVLKRNCQVSLLAWVRLPSSSSKICIRRLCGYADRFASMLIGKIRRMAIPNRNCLSPPSYHPSCKARVILSVTSKPVDKLHGLNDFCMGAAAFSSKICIYPSPTSNTPSNIPSNPPSKLHCPLYSPLCFALS